MQISPSQIIAGVPARALRDFFKKRQGTEFSPEHIAAALALASDQTVEVTNELLQLGLIVAQRARHWETEPWYELTTAGGQLAQASLARRMRRDKADRLLRQVVSNAVSINEDDDLTHRVVELRVFGSYLSDAEDLGDLDIAIALAPRHPDRDLVMMGSERADRSGVSNLSGVERIGYGEIEVMQLLRGGEARVSLHQLDELTQLGISGTRVFPGAG